MKRFLFLVVLFITILVNSQVQPSTKYAQTITDKELKEIDKIAKTYGNNYKIKYKKKRPSLVKLKKIYEEAINPDPNIGIDSEVIPFVESSFIKKLKYNKCVKAVEKLIKF